MIIASQLTRTLRLARILTVGLGIVVLQTLLSTSGRADEVDVAVDAFELTLKPLGISPGTEVKQLIKTMVRCAMANQPALNCARDEAIKRLPEEARPIASCMLTGQRIDNCAKNEILSRMPPQAKTLVACVSTAKNLGSCAVHTAGNPTQREVLETIGRLKIDGQSEFIDASKSQFRNILKVAEGIRDDDWEKVSIYGAGEVYKLVAKAVLRIVIPAGHALAPVIDPVVDAVVQSRVDLVVGLIEAVKRRNQAKIARLVVEFYLIAKVEITCALFNVIPNDDASEALKTVVCGTVGKVIKVIGGAAGDVAKAAQAVVSDAMREVGLDPTDIFSEDCPPDPQVYTRAYGVCMRSAALLHITHSDKLKDFTGGMHGECRNQFRACSSGLFGGSQAKMRKHCTPLDSQGETQAAALAKSVQSVAHTYARVHLSEVLELTGRNGTLCEVGRSDRYLSACGAAISRNLPGIQSKSWDQCRTPFPANEPKDIFKEACRREACGYVNANAYACLVGAKQAIDTVQRARAIRCDPKVLTGRRWSPELNFHLSDCIEHGRAHAAKEQAWRNKTMSECPRV